MFKKTLASIVTAAILVAGPGQLTLTAAAQMTTRAVVPSVSATPTIAAGLTPIAPAPVSLNTLLLPLAARTAPVAVPLAQHAKLTPAAANTTPIAPLALIQSEDPNISLNEKGAALKEFFDQATPKPQEDAPAEVVGQPSAGTPSLSPAANTLSAKTPSSLERAAVDLKPVTDALADFGRLVSRAWDALLVLLRIKVKQLETPEVVAQRVIDQLNAAKPVYNRKVQDASTLVEKIKLQIASEQAKVAELEKGITALLSDSDPSNDVMAGGLINQQKILNASIAATQEQLVLSEKALASIKEERARFFAEREETIAKIKAGLNRSAAADVEKKLAELKGGFQVEELKGALDEFEKKVGEKQAEAKGATDSANSNPDEILKKAKDSLKNQELKEEIARRKAALEQAKKDKAQTGGMVHSQLPGLIISGALGVLLPWNMPLVALVGTLVIGGISFTMNLNARHHMEVSNKLFAFNQGAAIATLALHFTGTPGVFYALATTFAANIMGFIHRALHKHTSAEAKEETGGALKDYPREVWVMGTVGALFTWATPWGALLTALLIGVLSLRETLTAEQHLAQSTKFFALSIGASVTALMLLLTGGGAPFFAAAAATLVSHAMAKTHRVLSQRKAADDKDDKTQTGGLLTELGVGAAIIAVLALVSAEFRGLLVRAWDALLVLLRIKVKQLETPEVVAQRVIDQLNAAKPVYNRKVQDASTLVEKIKLQIASEQAKVAELEKGITALLSDSDPSNDVMAGGLINQQKILNASIAATQEQLVLSEKALASIKEERARFFAEREETIAKIKAGLNRSAAADVEKKLAELKGGFQVEELKGALDEFEKKVGEKQAEAKGATDSANSNPDEILKKAKDSLKNQELKEEIARRKAALEQAKKDKAKTGGELSRSQAISTFAKILAVGFALILPLYSAAVFGAAGMVAFVLPAEKGLWLGKQLAIVGLGTLGSGVLATLAAAKLGLVVGAFGIGFGFIVPAVIALAAGMLVAIRAPKTDAGSIAKDKTDAGGKLSYPIEMFIAGASGVLLTWSMPLVALIGTAAAGVLSLRMKSDVMRHLEMSNLFFIFDIGAGVASLLLFPAGGAPFVFAGLTALASYAMGNIHRVLSMPADKEDKKDAGGKLSYSLDVYAGGVIGFFLTLAFPAGSLLIGLLSIAIPLIFAQSRDSLLDQGRKATAFSVGTLAAALVTLVALGSGSQFLSAGIASIVSAIGGKINLRMSHKDADKTDAGGQVRDASKWIKPALLIANLGLGLWSLINGSLIGIAAFAVISLLLNDDLFKALKMEAQLRKVEHNSKVRDRYLALSNTFLTEVQQLNPSVRTVLAYPLDSANFDGTWEIGAYFDDQSALEKASLPVQYAGLTVKKKMFADSVRDDLARLFPKLPF